MGERLLPPSCIGASRKLRGAVVCRSNRNGSTARLTSTLAAPIVTGTVFRIAPLAHSLSPLQGLTYCRDTASARKSKNRFFVRDSVVAGDHHGGCVIVRDMGEADPESDCAELMCELLQRRLDRIVGYS